MAKEAQPIDMVVEVYVPAAIIAALFVINGIVLFFIFKKRKEIDYDDIMDDGAVGVVAPSGRQQQNSVTVEQGRAIEMEAL